MVSGVLQLPSVLPSPRDVFVQLHPCSQQFSQTPLLLALGLWGELLARETTTPVQTVADAVCPLQTHRPSCSVPNPA